MADNCYYWMNNLLKVDYIKIDTNVDLSYATALSKANKMQTSTTLFKNFFKEDNITPSIYAKYFSPEDIGSASTFVIYRKTPEQKYYDYVCTLTQGDHSFLDYNIVNNQYYHYMAWIEVFTTPTTPEYVCYEDIGENGIINYIGTSFDRWSICDIEETNEERTFIKTGNLWSLGLNMDNPELTHNLSITTWDTLGQYGKVSMGAKNYESSSFTGLLGDMKEYVIYDIPQHGEFITGTIPPERNDLTKAQENIKKDLLNTQELALETSKRIQVAEAESNVELTKKLYEMLDGYNLKISQLEVAMSNLNKESFKINSNYILYQKLNKQVYRYTEKMDTNNPYARETEKLKSWKEFCANGNLKLLRDLKGHAWIVQITESPKNSISLGDDINQTTISFSWQEIENVNDYSIIKIL